MNATAATPLAELRQGLHTSVSQIKAYLMCPKKYAFQYVLGTPPSHRAVALSFGSAVHHALALFYERLRDEGAKPPIDEVQEAFADRWAVEQRDDVPIRFDEGHDAGSVKDHGIVMLAAFDAQGFVPDQVVAVEQPFACDLADPETGEVLDIPLVGAIDLVAVHQGRTVLVEHKTAARRFDETRLRYDPQPSAYVHAARTLRIVNPQTAFQILLKQKKPTVETIALTRTAADETEMLQTFTSVLKGIEAGVFVRNRGWGCADCQFKHRCDQ